VPSQAETPLEPLVRKLGYWAEFDDEDREAILSLPHTARSIPRLGHIVSEREKVTQSCVLLSGFAIRHKVVANGARQIMAIHMKGDLVDLQNSFLGVADQRAGDHRK
jgi:CRP-like cAMP-binding protein